MLEDRVGCLGQKVGLEGDGVSYLSTSTLLLTSKLSQRVDSPFLLIFSSRTFYGTKIVVEEFDQKIRDTNTFSILTKTAKPSPAEQSHSG
jgi:hypothetical protein